MQVKRLGLVYIIVILIVIPVLTISIPADGTSPSNWNAEFSYRQEIKLPIITKDVFAKHQPIDIHVEFNDECWAKSQEEHSIRVCCWDGSNWHELESQIYDLEFNDPYHIESCGLIFLVPEFANGEERYFVYYDDSEKQSPNYEDHVDIIDDYYYYEPISGISLEGDYYQINEDGYAVFVIGQKGKMINRKLSQAVMTMKPETKKFELTKSKIFTAFTFGYNIGKDDEDQVASDQKLVSKDVRINGNLMVEFGLVSESDGQELRTTNIYRYYYCPTDHKRLCVNVKHEVLKDVSVKGQLNVDGTYGALVSFKSRSSTIKGMRFGEIFPYLHFYGENNQIREYNMNTNPECKDRQWIVPLKDDCDIGKNSWFSVDEGESGKAHGIIFSSNEDIVKYGKNEKDGIQIKAAEKEYLDVLGAEIDYSGVMFGRNSYEKGQTHDLSIPGDLVVEFDAEIFSTEDGGYNDVILEREYFNKLVKLRQNGADDLFDEDENIYTLTVIAKYSGAIFKFPRFTNLTGIKIFDLWGELYQDNKIVATGSYYKPFFGFPKIKFPKLAAGSYILKIYRKIGNQEKKIIALDSVEIKDDKLLFVVCTWQKNLKISAKDSNGNRIEGVELTILKNETLLLYNTSVINEDLNFKVNYNLFRPYYLKACYKGFCVYYKQIPRVTKNIDIDLDLYDLTINIEDLLGFSPGVNVRPTLTSSEMDYPVDLTFDESNDANFIFKNLLPARYKLQISYGRFFDETYINVPGDGSLSNIRFSAIFDLRTNLLDSRGNDLDNNGITLEIKRNGKIIEKSACPDEVITLPPGNYDIFVYQDGKQISEKTINLNTDLKVNIVTEVESIFPILVTGLVIVFLLEILVIFAFKKISLNTFLKLLAISLVFLSLFQPWWVLSSQSKNPVAEKNSEMYIIPQAMIEKTTYDGKTHLELATVPEMFTNFVGTLLFIIYIGIVLLAFSFITNILLKRRYFIILISASVLFLTLVAVAFSFGMSKITEISLGSLNGEGLISVILPNGESINMASTWGLGSGFYLCILAATILIFTGVIDFLRKKHFPKIFFKK